MENDGRVRLQAAVKPITHCKLKSRAAALGVSIGLLLDVMVREKQMPTVAPPKATKVAKS